MNITKISKYIFLIAICIILFFIYNIENDKYQKEFDAKTPPFETITLGKSKWDTENDGKIEEDIVWYVVKEDSDKKLLVSKDIVVSSRYNNSPKIASWEDSDLRWFLNNTFYESFFSSSEKEKILETLVPIDINDKYKTQSGYSTYDKIFILSNSEVEKYLKEYSTTSLGKIASATGATYFYWTRTNGYTNFDACYVDGFGKVNKLGYLSTTSRMGIRPAMWIKK